MKVVDLHPEDLIDKLAAGELSAPERERLDAHLSQCRVCRFELDVRAELEQEMPPLEARPHFGAPSVTERLRPPSEGARVSVRARSRRRWPLALLAAAMVLCAGGAMAAVMSGALPARWLPWVPETKPAQSAAPTESNKASAKVKRAASKPAAALPGDPAPLSSAEPSAPALPSPSVESASVESAPAPATRASRVALSSAAPASPKSVAAAPSAALSDPATPSAAFEATSAHAEDAPARLDPAAALFADANRARRDGNADRAVTLYRSLQSRYPSSRESDLSRALLAQLLLDRGSPEAALSGFDRYLAEDAPVLSAEALVGRARALEQLGRSTQAITAWRDVQSRFPGSVHARLAATRLAALGMQ